MTREQTKIIELLAELDKICVENGISYYLVGNALKQALNSGCFENKTITVNIAMTISDIFRLREMTAKEGNNKREWSSMFDDENFQDMSFKYVNKDTTFIKLIDEAPIKAKGMFISVLVLRDGNLAVQERKRINALKENREEFIKAFAEGHKNADINSKLTLRHAQKMIKCAPGVFGKARRINFEDIQVMIPAKAEEYLINEYGEHWMEKNTSQPNFVNVIVDADLPYEEYLDYLKANEIPFLTQENILKTKELKAAIKATNDEINDAWLNAKLSTARVVLWEKYFPLKEQILKLAKKEKWDELAELIDEYLYVSYDFYQKDRAICFDFEIFEAYLKLLKNTGKAKMAEKLLDLLPDEHKKPLEIK